MKLSDRAGILTQLACEEGDLGRAAVWGCGAAEDEGYGHCSNTGVWFETPSSKNFALPCLGARLGTCVGHVLSLSSILQGLLQSPLPAPSGVCLHPRWLLPLTA